MGFTIQDMLITSENQFQMKLIAGNNGWSNSISWVLMVEDTTIINNFYGKELAVTTGLGFQTTEALLDLAGRLVKRNAAGLIVNTGFYVMEVPKELIDYCNENDLPLIDVPWEVLMGDMIKDLSMRVFLQGTADEQISEAFIEAIKHPDRRDEYGQTLLPFYDIDGQFQVVLFSTDTLDSMDTVERKKLSYRLQIYLENISHNGFFFYYDSCFVLILNDVGKADFENIVHGMISRTKQRMPDDRMYCGVGSVLADVSNLRTGYKRAKTALKKSIQNKSLIEHFDEMGMERLFSKVSDQLLLKEMGEDVLSSLIEYDKKHDSNYVETLGLYLKHNGSIQAVADELFTHRNTVVYRISNIKKLLDTELDDAEERFKLQVATRIINYTGGGKEQS